MRKLLTRFLVIIPIIFFLSCSVTYTTQQVLTKLKTKGDLVKYLGQPDEKKHFPEIEEWVYNLDTTTVAARVDKRVTLPGILIDSTNTTTSESGAIATKADKHDTLNKNPQINPDSLKATHSAEHNRNIKFIIDTNARVVSYKNNGVVLTGKGKKGLGGSVLEGGLNTLKAIGTLAVLLVVLVVYIKQQE